MGGQKKAQRYRKEAPTGIAAIIFPYRDKNFQGEKICEGGDNRKAKGEVVGHFPSHEVYQEGRSLITCSRTKLGYGKETARDARFQELFARNSVLNGFAEKTTGKKVKAVINTIKCLGTEGLPVQKKGKENGS